MRICEVCDTNQAVHFIGDTATCKECEDNFCGSPMDVCPNCGRPVYMNMNRDKNGDLYKCKCGRQARFDIYDDEIQVDWLEDWELEKMKEQSTEDEVTL